MEDGVGGETMLLGEGGQGRQRSWAFTCELADASMLGSHREVLVLPSLPM